jgi:predicted  nucleic acid-binding Zn-ribbon protein
MSEHDERAQDLERELEDMEEHSERLEGEIDDAREDWERKKADSGVPGAPPDPEDEGGPETGAKYPTKRDADDDL